MILPDSASYSEFPDGETIPLYKRIRDFDRTYTIRVSNGIAVSTIQLFGAKQFLFAPAGFVVTVLESTYQELLQESLINPFTIGGATMSTSALNIQNIAFVINRDPNGKQTQMAFHPSSYFSVNQYPANYVEIFPIDLQIDGDTILQFTMQPNTNLDLTLFVKKRIHLDNMLHDEPVMEKGSEQWLDDMFKGEQVSLAPSTVSALAERVHEKGSEQWLNSIFDKQKVSPATSAVSESKESTPPSE